MNHMVKIKNFHTCYQIDPNLNISIKRIASHKELQAPKLIPIKNSAYFYFSLQLNTDPLKLPKLYAALSHYTGDSDNNYYDYKGSFSFMFELRVEKEGTISKFVYHMYHYRSYIEFSIYQVVLQNDARNPDHYHAPDEKILADNDISILSSSFCNQLIKQIEAEQYTPPPFVKYSDSNLILFGYLNGEYFYRDYEDQEEYIRAKVSF